mgnify:CR=1 FL=1
MARPPEVSEESIIQAGLELEECDKTPNPGAIRAHLGYRGGLMRIKSIWGSFDKKRQQKLLPEKTTELNFDSLPESYASNALQLMDKVSIALEQLTIEAYVNSRQLFEKRAKAQEKSNQESLTFYIEAEKSADKSIIRLEAEVDDIQKELQQLAQQNANLLIVNSELRGRLTVYDEGFSSKPLK